jgi:hypothetical protein
LAQPLGRIPQFHDVAEAKAAGAQLGLWAQAVEHQMKIAERRLLRGEGYARAAALQSGFKVPIRIPLQTSFNLADLDSETAFIQAAEPIGGPPHSPAPRIPCIRVKRHLPRRGAIRTLVHSAIIITPTACKRRNGIGAT